MVDKVFNHRWNPSEARPWFKEAFSPSSWNALPMAKNNCTVYETTELTSNCRASYILFPKNDPTAKSDVPDENSVSSLGLILPLSRLANKFSTNSDLQYRSRLT